METLRAQNIPAEQVITSEQMYDPDFIGAQLDARGFYDEFEHPITGSTAFLAGRFASARAPARHHRSASPTLGQHNDEILRGLGLSEDELDSPARRTGHWRAGAERLSSVAAGEDTLIR